MYNSSKRIFSMLGGKNFDDVFGEVLSKFEKMKTPMNVVEEKDRYVVELIAVGLEKKDISIKIDGDKLVVKGNTDITDRATVHREFFYGNIDREIGFSHAVDLKSTKAKLECGLLTITVLKSDKQVGPSTIDID